MTRALPLTGGTPRDVAQAVNSILQGKINSVGSVTLTESDVSTTVDDPRVTNNSAIIFRPQTANAAALAAPYVLQSDITEGESFVITHASAAHADLTFAYVILG